MQALDTKRFNLNCPKDSFTFKFMNEHDAAHWMRAVGDATVGQVVQRSTEATRRSEQMRLQQEEETRKKAAFDAAPKENVKYGDTGATSDKLSMQFGV